MKLTTTIRDNVGELLSKILEFTEQRRLVLTQNITNVNTPGFIPKDLDVEGFAGLMAQAVAEHMRHERLVLFDTESIQFGPDGYFVSQPLVDTEAKELLKSEPKAYLENQVNKLAENLINNKVAHQLLQKKRQKELQR
ncbi:MAG: hypothetical protein JXA82_16055 [Sedimentisphaerales bacterium]|nr:hypothetical protein [Sedimentisphaerales bacterium]